jgi:2-polyprenyl-3-methyl-5-hydroxy-6-metoxy-1,4-benzoquinol methylase
MATTEYILGHSEKEIQRLIHQARILRPITERLLRETGLEPGMRVLDLGCGAGDVSMLAAEMVGPSGVVIGIDRSPDVLLVARSRSREARLPQVVFKETSLDSFSDPSPFDAVIGRYVLIHQANPTAFLRAAASHVRPGGILALHELGYMTELLHAHEDSPFLHQVTKWLMQAMHTGAPHVDVGRRIIEEFNYAQLPQPNMFCELPIGGGTDSTISDWCVDTLETLLPLLIKERAIPEEMISIKDLKAQIAEDVRASHFQVVGVAQICAWATL